MNMHTPDLQKIDAEHKARQARLNPTNPVAKVVRTEAFYIETLHAMKHVNSVLRRELDEMKAAIREKNVEITALKLQVSRWEGDSDVEVISMRDICQKVLDEHYPGVTMRNIHADSRQPQFLTPRQHCFYAVYIERPDASLTLKAKFFKRDKSSYRRGVKRYAASIGVRGRLLGAEIGVEGAVI